MTVEFILDISKNDGLVCDFEGMDELDLRVEVEPYFEDGQLSDLEIKEVEVCGENGWVLLPESLHGDVYQLLYYSPLFADAIIEQAAEERADHELERRLNSLELESCFSN